MYLVCNMSNGHLIFSVSLTQLFKILINHKSNNVHSVCELRD